MSDVQEQEIALISALWRSIHHALDGMRVLGRPGVRLTDAQRAVIDRHVHKEQRQRITAAKRRARIVTRAKGSKRP